MWLLKKLQDTVAHSLSSTDHQEHSRALISALVPHWIQSYVQGLSPHLQSHPSDWPKLLEGPNHFSRSWSPMTATFHWGLQTQAQECDSYAQEIEPPWRLTRICWTHSPKKLALPRIPMLSDQNANPKSLLLPSLRKKEKNHKIC